MNSLLIKVKIVFSLSLYAVSNSDICTSEDGYTVCCPGYVWNDREKRCKQCNYGKYGPRCEKVCPFPWYGRLCVSKCNCTQDYCDPVYGCFEWTSSATTFPLVYQSEGQTTSPCADNFNDISTSNDTKGKHHTCRGRKNKHPIDQTKMLNMYQATVCLIIIGTLMCILYAGLVRRGTKSKITINDTAYALA